MNRSNDTIQTVCIIAIVLFYGIGFSKERTLPLLDTIANVPIVVQTNAPEWCWAACSKSLCHYFNKNFKASLKDVAKEVTTDPDSCPDQPYLSTVLKNIIKKYCPKTTTEYKEGPLPVAEVISLIQSKRPFIYVIKASETGYHCNVICGYKTSPDTTTSGSIQVYVMDPGMFKKFWITYDAFGMKKDKGSFGSLIVNKLTTDIQINPPTPVSYEPFTIKALPSNPFLVQLHITGFHDGLSTIKIFSSKGMCVCKTEVSSISHNSLINIPFHAGPGMYVVTCQSSNNTKAQSSFFTLK